MFNSVARSQGLPERKDITINLVSYENYPGTGDATDIVTLTVSALAPVVEVTRDRSTSSDTFFPDSGPSLWLTCLACSLRTAA